MRTSISQLVLVSVLSYGSLVTSTSFGQTSSTPSTIPAAGNAVKPGDIIIWNVNKPIMTEPSPEAQATSASAEDEAAAAAALKTAAHAAIEPAAVAASAPKASPLAKAHLQAVVAAGDKAD